MSQVLVVTSGKGGVGKTTIVANLATGLAMRGKKTVMVDTDIGLRNLDVILGLENRIVYDLVDVVEGVCKLRQALIRDKRAEGLYLLPAAQTRDKSAISPEQMKELVQKLCEQFEYVIIDCPAGIEQGFRNAIAPATGAIVVTMPEVSAVRDADRIIGLLSAAGLAQPRLIINRIRPELVRRGDMLSVEDTLDILGVELLGVVPDDTEVIRGANVGRAVVTAAGAAGQALRDIVARLEGEVIPIATTERRGLFARWGKRRA